MKICFLFFILIATASAYARTQEEIKNSRKLVRTQNAEGAEKRNTIITGSSGSLSGAANTEALNALVGVTTNVAIAVPLLAQCPIPAGCIQGVLSVGAAAIQLGAAISARQSEKKIRSNNSAGSFEASDMALGRSSGLGVSADANTDPLPPHTSADSSGGGGGSINIGRPEHLNLLQQKLNHLQTQANNQGYSYNAEDDTITTPKGTYPAEKLNSLDKLQKEGFLSAADRPAAEAFLKKAQKQAAAKVKKLLRRNRSSSASGRSFTKELQFQDPDARPRSSFYFLGKKKISGQGKALYRNIAGERVGVFSDSLFGMIYRKYQQKSKTLLKR